MNVLIVSFNRPDLIQKQLVHLLSLNLDLQIFLHNDGPRPNNHRDKNSIDDIKHLVKSFGINSERTVFLEENFGCRLGVRKAIDWFFTRVDVGIIVEDDVIIKPAGLNWMIASLHSYRDSSDCFLISAQSVLTQECSEPYLSRSKVPMIWGWATWREKWELLEDSYSDIPALIGLLRSGFSFKFSLQVLSNSNLVKKGLLDTWDTDVLLWLVTKQAFCLAPSVNLSENLGIGGEEATHTHEEMRDVYLFSEIKYQRFIENIENMPLVNISPNTTMSEIYQIKNKSIVQILIGYLKVKLW